MSSYWKAVCGVILIFVLGCIAGWLGASVVGYRETTLFLQRGPEAVADLLERRTTRGLDLDANQKQQIHELFLENVKQRKLLQSEIQPQVQMLNRETFRQMLALLRPDQTERFHRNVALFRQRFDKSGFNPNAQNEPPPISGAEGSTTNSGVGTPAP